MKTPRHELRDKERVPIFVLPLQGGTNTYRQPVTNNPELWARRWRLLRLMARQPEGQRAQATFQNISRAPITVPPLSQHFFCKGTSFPHFWALLTSY